MKSEEEKILSKDLVVLPKW